LANDYAFDAAFCISRVIGVICKLEELLMDPGLFEFKKVSQEDPLIEEIYKLRYRIYVEKWGFLKREDNPGGIEKDEFDPHSVHFVVQKRGENQVVGTIRIIANSAKGFPIEKHCKINRDLSLYDKDCFGEISRLAVSKEFRRRATDSIYSNWKELNDAAIDALYSEQRKIDNDIVLGLYRCIYKESLERGNQFLLAVMARGLYLLLKSVGILFEPIGPEQDYHGLRAPYLGRIDTMLQELKKRNPALYTQFTK
jgi:N-acyl amino acid synthase of PEP-CTERM/exosortase system